MPYQSCGAVYKMGCIKLWLLCDATEYGSRKCTDGIIIDGFVYNARQSREDSMSSVSHNRTKNFYELFCYKTHAILTVCVYSSSSPSWGWHTNTYDRCQLRHQRRVMFIHVWCGRIFVFTHISLMTPPYVLLKTRRTGKPTERGVFYAKQCTHFIN